MESTDVAQLAAIAGAMGAILMFIAAGRVALLAGFALLAVAGGGLSTALAGSVALDRATSPAALAAGAAVGAVLVTGSVAFVRWPGAIIPLVAVTTPFRPPIDFGADNRYVVAIATDGRIGRLLPLYGVLAAAALATAYRVLRGGRVEPLPRELAYPGGIFTGLVATSLLWSHDVRAGADLLLFFVLPTTLLVGVVGRSPARPWLARVLLLIVVGISCSLATIGLWQAYAQELFFATPRVQVGNVYADFFRVTSLFNDPSLYGRHVVVGIVVVIVAMWARSMNVVLAAGAIALLWTGLYFSYSQSSMVALLVTAVAIVVVMGNRSARTIVLVAAALIALLGATAVAASVQDQSIDRITSDRSRRIDLTVDVFTRNPLAGVGIGGHPAATAELAPGNRPEADFVSHTTPLTIAAELGAVGLAAWLLLMAGAIVMFERVRRVDEAMGVGLGAVFLALFVHSLFYGGFFEDPLVWLVLGVGAAVLIAKRDPQPAAAT